MSYVPQPGTIAARVVAFLAKQPADAEFAGAVLGDALDVDGSNLSTFLANAVAHGAVAREKRDGRIYWRRGSGISAAPAQDQDDDEPVVQRYIPATKSSGVSLVDAPAWSPPKETAVNNPLPPPKPAKKPRVSAPVFDPLTIELKKDRALPPNVRAGASPYQALIARMQPGDSVDLPTAAAKSMVSAAKKTGIKLATRVLDETTTGVWRL